MKKKSEQRLSIFRNDDPIILFAGAGVHVIGKIIGIECSVDKKYEYTIRTETNQLYKVTKIRNKFFSKNLVSGVYIDADLTKIYFKKYYVDFSIMPRTLTYPKHTTLKRLEENIDEVNEDDGENI